MKTFEIEITRNNVTPAEFLRYVRNRVDAKGGAMIRSDLDATYFAAGNDLNFDISHIPDDENGLIRERSISRPYEMQTFCKWIDGTQYNEICEFSFDDEKRGHGYYYLINVCADDDTQPAQDAETETETETMTEEENATDGAQGEENNMKKYTEILEEIKTARESITDTAKTEKEIERAALKETARDGSPEEIEKARAAFTAACERMTAETNRNNEIKMKIEILKENTKQALFAENINAICDVWNKYENKPHGEKTAQKIRDEIKNATGLRVYIGNRWDDAQITIYPSAGTCADEITIAPRWTGEKQPALTAENKIKKLHPENMRVCYCAEYVHDVNAHIKALKEAHAAALDALETYRAAINKYNELTRGNMSRASDREGVKHYII